MFVDYLSNGVMSFCRFQVMSRKWFLPSLMLTEMLGSIKEEGADYAKQRDRRSNEDCNAAAGTRSLHWLGCNGSPAQ